MKRRADKKRQNIRAKDSLCQPGLEENREPVFLIKKGAAPKASQTISLR